VPQIRTWTLIRVIGLLVVFPTLCPAQVAGPSERLLPATTKGAVFIADCDKLSEQWNKTQMGKLLKDPVMEPFAKDLRRQFQDRWSGVHDRLGLTLDDLKGVPGGELAVALIQPGPDLAATAILVDVTGHLDEAGAMLGKVAANMKKKGAKQTEHTIAGTKVILFDMPKDDEGGPEQVVYFLSGNTLGAADHLATIQGILARMTGQAGSSLAEVPGFQAVMNRCKAHAGKAVPQIRWFLEPIGYFETRQAVTSQRKVIRTKKDNTALEIARNQGFERIRGVGGFVDFAVDRFELLHRTAVFAPPPYEKSMKMLVFPNSTQFAPQPWIPRDVATYTTFYWDVLNAFDNFGSLFDELFGEPEFLFSVNPTHQAEFEKGQLGEKLRKEFKNSGLPLAEKVEVVTKRPGELWHVIDGKKVFIVKKGKTLRVYMADTGMWEEVLESLKEQEDGPQIDLRKDLVSHLGKRVTVITDYKLPITTTSEQLLFAIKATDVKAVTAGLKKLMENDPTIKRREYKGQVIWETVEEAVDHPTLQIDLPTLPGQEPDKGDKNNDEEAERLLPNASTTVAFGHLLVASRYKFLVKVLDKAKDQESLGQAVDFRAVDATLKELGATESSVRVFSRTDEEYRPTYELIRQGKMPESETLFGRMLNATLGPNKKGVVREQKIDGSELPDYQVVRRNLGPAGIFVSSEPEGWFAVGFMLPK